MLKRRKGEVGEIDLCTMLTRENNRIDIIGSMMVKIGIVTIGVMMTEEEIDYLSLLV